MPPTNRIPEELFEDSGHYLGRPADADDRIIDRRIRLVENIPDFTGPELTLLDIGCGNGASMFRLAPKMKRCVGIEIGPMHEDEFERLKSEGGFENCSFRIADVVTAEPSEQFDRIISFEVIEHLTSEDGLEFYRRSLADDGILAITVPNKWWIFETHGADLPVLPWNRVPFFSWLPRSIHERFANARIYTRARICRLLEKHGFEIVETRYVTAPMDVLPEGRLKEFLIRKVFDTDTTSLPPKATSIFVVARKRPKT